MTRRWVSVVVVPGIVADLVALAVPDPLGRAQHNLCAKKCDHATRTIRVVVVVLSVVALRVALAVVPLRAGVGG